jgi:hypothetical protein
MHPGSLFLGFSLFELSCSSNTDIHFDVSFLLVFRFLSYFVISVLSHQLQDISQHQQTIRVHAAEMVWMIFQEWRLNLLSCTLTSQQGTGSQIHNQDHCVSKAAFPNVWHCQQKAEKKCLKVRATYTSGKGLAQILSSTPIFCRIKPSSWLKCIELLTLSLGYSKWGVAMDLEDFFQVPSDLISCVQTQVWHTFLFFYFAFIHHSSSSVSGTILGIPLVKKRLWQRMMQLYIPQQCLNVLCFAGHE